MVKTELSHDQVLVRRDHTVLRRFPLESVLYVDAIGVIIVTWEGHRDLLSVFNWFVEVLEIFLREHFLAGLSQLFVNDYPVAFEVFVVHLGLVVRVVFPLHSVASTKVNRERYP